jgi:hypothetical protein
MLVPCSLRRITPHRRVAMALHNRAAHSHKEHSSSNSSDTRPSSIIMVPTAWTRGHPCGHLSMVCMDMRTTHMNIIIHSDDTEVSEVRGPHTTCDEYPVTALCCTHEILYTLTQK